MLSNIVGSVLKPFASVGLSVLKGYLVKLATKEFVHWAFFEIGETIVERTDTKEDDRWLKAIKNQVSK